MRLGQSFELRSEIAKDFGPSGTGGYRSTRGLKVELLLVRVVRQEPSQLFDSVPYRPTQSV
jgi:hypothetical protein